MAGDTMRFRNPAGHAGLLNNLVSLANSLAGFFESRFGLFARESKGALVHLLLLAGALAPVSAVYRPPRKTARLSLAVAG